MSMRYNHFEIEKIMNTFTILVDSREKPTDEYEQRLNQMKCKINRVAMNYGDYTCKVTLPNGEVLDFSQKVVIERKQNLDELIQNFIDRDSIREDEDGNKTNRIQREFIRARKDGCRIYLLIENANWENAFNGKYRSKLHPNAFTAFLTAWSIRYHLQILFCKAETSGKLIKQILYREVKEYLTNLEEGERIGANKAISGSG